MTNPLATLPKKKKRFSDDLIYQTILETCQAAGPEGAVRPEDVARQLYPGQWQTLLKRIRLYAHQLAQRGDILILRKGELTDPADEVKGLIKLRISPTYTPPRDVMPKK